MALMSGMSQTMDELVNDPDYIKTVTFNKPPENMLPIFEMGEVFALSFDDVIADEADYYYQFEHYDYDWKPSRLFKNEFLEGIDDMRIFNYRNSFTTVQPYSHYELRIPNQFTQGFKVSGNYMIHIYNTDRELVFSRKFMVLDEKSSVGVEIKRARDLEYVNTQQRVQFFVDSREINFLNPDQQLKTVLIQNCDLTTAISGIKPQFNLGNKQVYRYDEETSFWAGNEYLNFENRDFRSPNVNIDYVTKEELYNAFLFADGPRILDEYTFNPDINGNFLVTTLDNEDNAVQAEYVNIHFALDPNGLELAPDARIFVMGNYNAFQLQPENEAIFNPKSGRYEATILLKQGFYNYRYTVVYENGQVAPGLISGNKWQTENQYSVLAYYRELGGRYDQLIGIGEANSRNITN
ncbi:type IX secretion system plug protein [Nonlabens xiamenensis]|uniref:type IX secretion system plug protein n=1 Tax=Nonlabens xiamenensis TaxID=2341043 RepID=UPI001F0CB2FF|nr:type IX secretion system plug protein domain-containing protein [Nonlabens xiamenensis]